MASLSLFLPPTASSFNGDSSRPHQVSSIHSSGLPSPIGGRSHEPKASEENFFRVLWNRIASRKRTKSDTSACLALSKQSPSSPTIFICRICHEGDRNEPLLSPCSCSGSMGLIHKSCLERWLSMHGQDDKSHVCELCGHKYSVQRTPKPCNQWLCTRPITDDQRNLFGDLFCLLLLTPLALISSYLCAVGADYYYTHTGRNAEAQGLLFLSVFLVLVYLLWLALTLRFHLAAWIKWRRKNQQIRLVLPEQSRHEQVRLDLGP